MNITMDDSRVPCVEKERQKGDRQLSSENHRVQTYAAVPVNQESGKGNPEKIPYHRIHPHRIYTSRDIKLLEKTDELHSVDEMTQWEIVVCAPKFVKRA